MESQPFAVGNQFGQSSNSRVDLSPPSPSFCTHGIAPPGPADSCSLRRRSRDRSFAVQPGDRIRFASRASWPSDRAIRAADPVAVEGRLHRPGRGRWDSSRPDRVRGSKAKRGRTRLLLQSPALGHERTVHEPPHPSRCPGRCGTKPRRRDGERPRSYLYEAGSRGADLPARLILRRPLDGFHQRPEGPLRHRERPLVRLHRRCHDRERPTRSVRDGRPHRLLEFVSRVHDHGLCRPAAPRIPPGPGPRPPTNSRTPGDDGAAGRAAPRIEVSPRHGHTGVQDAMWADDRLWLALADGCIPAGDNRVRSCVRLIEVDTANGTISQDFDLGISGKYLFYPALRTDAADNLVVVFGYSSATEYPEMRVATRSVHDPPNTIGAPQVIRAGEGPEASGCPNNSVCRYGDYFGASQDPSDPGIVWVAGEYGTANGWATFIAAMAETVQLTVAYAVQGGGSTYLAPTFTYVRGGQSVTVSLTTAPADFTVDAGTAWSVSPVLGGSGVNERWATNESVSGVAMKTEFLTFLYSHQFSASFAYRVTGGGSGYSAPSVSYEQFALARSDRANLTVWVDAGGAYSFPSSLVGSNASERWLADALNPNGTIVGSGVIEVAYRHQAFLTFGFQGPAESSISPASGWFDVGGSLTPIVTPAAGWAVGIWMGTGPGAYSGPQASPTILVGGPMSEIAILYPGLTITAGAGGSVSYSYGGISGTVAGGSTRPLYLSTGTTVMVVASPSSSYTFIEWSGATSSNRSNVNVTVTGPAQATAHFSLSASVALAFYSSIAAVGIILALVLVAVAVRRRRRRSEPPPPPLEPPLPPPPPP